METINNQTRLVNETQDINLAERLYCFAVEVDYHTGVSEDVVVDDLIKALKRIRIHNGMTLPPAQKTLKLLNRTFSKYVKIQQGKYSKIGYIKIGDSYVIYHEPGIYSLTPDKSQASKFPSRDSAEKYMRELSIEGRIVD